jgi:alkanesulfonate monooxygenase SsuD/methylene tetrahydromethanopterin reductase-like flavin-dependent oxidoreductase (luciferase family)
MSDIRAKLQEQVDEIKELWHKHQREDHSPESIEAARRAMGPWPVERPDIPRCYLQVSGCQVCQLYFEMTVDVMAVMPRAPFVASKAKIGAAL